MLLGCPHISSWEKKVLTCGNKWASQTRAQFLFLPVSLGRGGETHDCELLQNLVWLILLQSPVFHPQHSNRGSLGKLILSTTKDKSLWQQQASFTELSRGANWELQKEVLRGSILDPTEA